MSVAVEETEYTPYYDLMQIMGREFDIIPSNESNNFRPSLSDHPRGSGHFLLKSNPCNPTGVTLAGDSLRDLVNAYSGEGQGALIDEAYEFFTEDPLIVP